MRTIALVGAGGKMGCRITDNLKNGTDRVHYLEVSPAFAVNDAAIQVATKASLGAPASLPASPEERTTRRQGCRHSRDGLNSYEAV